MKCLGCGAEIEFSPKDKKLKCSYCGSEFEAKDYTKKIRAAMEMKEFEPDSSKPQIETKSYTCTQCGAKLLTFDDTAITFCSYCSSSNIIESELYKGEAPEYVIPFKITKEECENIYKKEIKKHIFAPKEMKDDVIIKKFRGIYMPYGVYTASHTGLANNYGEKYSHRSGDYVYYDKYKISVNVDAEYSGMSYDLSSNFYDKFSSAIGPFDFKEAEPFNISYLSGYYADSRDVKKDLYEDEAMDIIEPDTTKELLKHKEFRKYGCSKPILPYRITENSVAYYPVYFLAIRNKKNDAINYAVINGQTGKIAVELPIDFKKYLIFTLILAVIIFLILNTCFTFTPQFMLIISILLSFFNTSIAHKQKVELNKHENLTDDKGYNYAKKFDSTEQKNSKNLLKNRSISFFSILNILPFIISVGTLILNPIDDYFYYFAAIVSFIMILISFRGIINQFNLLTSRKLSQIGIRGGDEGEI